METGWWSKRCLGIGLLVLGRRFPKVARYLGSIGKNIAEFRKVFGR